MRPLLSAVALTTALVCSASDAFAQATASSAGTWAPIGVSWPSFTCTINCSGRTTPVAGSVAIPRFTGPGVLVGVSLELRWTVGGGYSGRLSSSGFVGVTTEVVGTATLRPANAPPIAVQTSSITTQNSMGATIIGISLNTANASAGPVVLPPAAIGAFAGVGSVSIPLDASFLQRVYPSSGSCTGMFALGGGATRLDVTATYTYWPSFFDLGGAIAGSTGAPSFVGLGSAQPGAPVSLQLGNAAPNAPAVLVTGLAPAPLPFLTGTLWVFPEVASLPLLTDANGAQVIPFLWPPSATGDQLSFQAAILDPSALFGLGLTSGLRGTTQ